MQVMPPTPGGGPSRLFILRPVATTLFMVAILLAGIIGYRALPVSALPEVDYPTIQVVTLYPGASPDVVTSSITAPLERQFGQMSGLKQMASQSSGARQSSPCNSSSLCRWMWPSRKCRRQLTPPLICCQMICLIHRFTVR